MKAIHALTFATVFSAHLATHAHAQDLGEGQYVARRLSGCLFVMDGAQWKKNKKNTAVETNLTSRDSTGAYTQNVSITRNQDGAWSLSVNHKPIDGVVEFVWQAPYEMWAQPNARGYLSQACSSSIKKGEMYIIRSDSLFVVDRTQPGLVHQINKDLRLYPLVSLVSGTDLQGESVYSILQYNPIEKSEEFVVAGTEVVMKQFLGAQHRLPGVDISEDKFGTPKAPAGQSNPVVVQTKPQPIPADTTQLPVTIVKPPVKIVDNTAVVPNPAKQSIPQVDQTKQDSDLKPNVFHRIGGWIKGAYQDSIHWVGGAAKTTGIWFGGAYDVSADWVKGAVKNSGTWLGNAYHNSAAWTKLAVKNSGLWFKGAYDNTIGRVHITFEKKNQQQ